MVMKMPGRISEIDKDIDEAFEIIKELNVVKYPKPENWERAKRLLEIFDMKLMAWPRLLS
jgi:hypothetical protein